MDEKASRTPAQKKIDSHILLAYKMQNSQAFASALPSYETDVKAGAQGKFKVDMEANITPQLLSDLRALGGEVIFSSEKFKSIVANIPLSKVEQIAEFKTVLHINQWLTPLNNSNYRCRKCGSAKQCG